MEWGEKNEIKIFKQQIENFQMICNVNIKPCIVLCLCVPMLFLFSTIL